MSLLNFTGLPVTLVRGNDFCTIESSGLICLTVEGGEKMPPFEGIPVTNAVTYNGVVEMPIIDRSNVAAIIVTPRVAEYLVEHDIGVTIFSCGGMGNLIMHRPLHNDSCNIFECDRCSRRDCPHGDALHYHHEGCPSCTDK